VWVISGAPGIGKSALVDAAGVELAGADGHYATGKFELARRAPFAAFVDAIDGLSDVLLARPEHERVLWRVRIGAALGGLGSALLELTPALQGLLGEQLPLPDVGSLEAKHRTELAIVRFFRAVASAEEPLLLFIDDLHWSDPGSIDVWERLALDEQCRGLVLVGAYRTRELGGTQMHAIRRCVRSFAKHNAGLCREGMEPLCGDPYADRINQFPHPVANMLC